MTQQLNARQRLAVFANLQDVNTLVGNVQANVVASSNLHGLGQEASAIEGVNLKLIVAFLWAINEDVFANGVSLGLCIAAFNAIDIMKGTIPSLLVLQNEQQNCGNK